MVAHCRVRSPLKRLVAIRLRARTQSWRRISSGCSRLGIGFCSMGPAGTSALVAAVRSPTAICPISATRAATTLTVPIGWHGNTFLGARVDLGYTQFSGNQFIGRGPSGLPVTLTNSTPKVFSGVGNLTARAPLNASKSLKIYALAGAGLYNFRDLGAASALSGFLGNDVLMKDESLAKKTRTKIGSQAGAGFELGNGPAQLFVETRFVIECRGARRDTAVRARRRERVDRHGARRASRPLGCGAAGTARGDLDSRAATVGY